MPPYPQASGTSTNPTIPPAPSNTATPLGRGESVYLFGVLVAGATQLPLNPTNVAGESPAAGTASIAINVGDYQDGGPAPGISFEGQFSGAPGAFEVDIQEADTDIDSAYILMTSSAAYKVTAVVGNNFRVDLVPTGGRFMRAVLVSRANAVSLILKATRLQ